MKAFASWAAFAALALSAAPNAVRAEDVPPTPLPEAAPAAHCGFKETIRKIVHPSTEIVPRTRVCYEYREYYEVKTCGAKTPILLPTCPYCDKHGDKEYPSPDCVKFGKPYKRRVLVKIIIREDVCKPKGVVECKKEVVPCVPIGDGGTPPPVQAIPAAKASR